ncbi:MAG: hypothetical protein KDA84_09020 [Planctomycetaceae bacterium]|nr:hypothetical protein [Planctomycetaceae bacterium]
MPIQFHLRTLKFPLLTGLGMVFLLSGLSGCGGESSPTGLVQGQVKMKGKPIEEGQVVLFSEPGRPVGSAPITSGGTFEFSAPVPAGNYVVAILPPAEEVPAGAEPSSAKPKIPAIPPKYRNEATSGLTAAIEPGENSLDLQIQ